MYGLDGLHFVDSIACIVIPQVQTTPNLSSQSLECILFVYSEGMFERL